MFGGLIAQPKAEYTNAQLKQRHEQRLQDKANKALLQELQEEIRRIRAYHWLGKESNDI